MKMSMVKRTIVTAVCIALGLVLPLAFHAVPNAGVIWTPMFIPILLCGLVCGGWFGLAAGAITPLLSSLLTGMPPVAFLPSMLCELAVYGLVSGFIMQFIRTKKPVLDLYIALILAMLIGRIVGGALNALLFAAGHYSLVAWVTGYFVTCLPGIIVQLLVIVPIVLALQQGRLIPRRYSENRISE